MLLNGFDYLFLQGFNGFINKKELLLINFINLCNFDISKIAITANFIKKILPHYCYILYH